jgi:hypothetical protein
MDEIKLKKYSDKLLHYFEEFKKKNINILQLGCYNKEVTKIFIDILTKKKSKLVCIDTFNRDIKYMHTHDYHTFQKQFFNIIEKSNKLDQINIMKIEINEGLKKLQYDNEMFDIIYIDMSYDHQYILYKIIVSWELLKNNGIIIFDNYKCSMSENQEKCPLFALKSFSTIYNNNINDITQNINFNQLNFFEKENYFNIDKAEDQIIFQKYKSNINKKFDTKIVNLCESLLNFDIEDEYELPILKSNDNDFDFNIKYYNNDEEGIKEIEHNINNKFKLDILNNMYHIYLHKNYLKYINYFILDINYLLHAKKYNYDIFLKYINKFLNVDMGIEKILNVYITKINIKNIILHSDFKMNNILTKNINILNTGSKKNNSAFSENTYKFLEKISSKNIHHYQIYNPMDKLNNIDNINKKNIFIPSNMSSKEDINKINKIIKDKIDFIIYNKVLFHKEYILKITNINKLYLLNNYYFYLLYLTLLKQKEGGYLNFPILHSFTDFFYEIIYILQLHYDNIKFKLYQIGNSISNYIIIIIGEKFKGINNKIFDYIKQVANDISDKKIKSLFNDKIKNKIKNKYNKILNSLMQVKINLFTIKSDIIYNLPQLSRSYKYYFYNLLLQKQLKFFYNKIENVSF